MKKLSELHENFLDVARRPMSFNRLPVMPRESDVPILPSNKWTKKDGSISKKYEFMSKDIRNEFVSELFEHEKSAGHHAKLIIDEDYVIVILQTKNIGQVTELDKEYAKYSDSVYKDVSYKTQEKKSIKPNIISNADLIKISVK